MLSASTYQLDDGRNIPNTSNTDIRIVGLSGSDHSSTTSENSIGTRPGEHLNSTSSGSCGDQKPSLPTFSKTMQNPGRTCNISSDESLVGYHETNIVINVNGTCDVMKVDKVDVAPLNVLVKKEELEICREGNIQSDVKLE